MFDGWKEWNCKMWVIQRSGTQPLLWFSVLSARRSGFALSRLSQLMTDLPTHPEGHAQLDSGLWENSAETVQKLDAHHRETLAPPGKTLWTLWRILM